jgi:hypothetical protein
MTTELSTTTRRVLRVQRGMPTSDGAGVKLTRVIGTPQLSELDPFLMLDEFGTDKAEDYIAGFPSHPHRGFETVTYMLAGRMRHRDNHGGEGVIETGGIQWMTAGRGIVHQEMPEGDDRGRMHGFQLWANLPSSLKMTAPRYQDIRGADIPEVVDDDGTRVLVVCGSFWGVTGPVDGIAAEPRYLDVSVPPETRRVLSAEASGNAFAYVFEGEAAFRDASEPLPVPTEEIGEPEDRAANRSLVLFDSGDEIVVRTGKTGVRFLLVSGRPIREPVAWRGPIVMNTEEELRTAYRQLEDGTFLETR